MFVPDPDAPDETDDEAPSMDEADRANGEPEAQDDSE